MLNLLTLPYRRFLKDSSGNLAVITALVAPLLLGMSAIALSTSEMTRVKQDLQTAVDAAALAASVIESDQVKPSEKLSIDDRKTLAESVFEENFYYSKSVLPQPEIKVENKNGVYETKVFAEVEVKHILSSFMPSARSNISVTSFATSSDIANHTEIYFIVDNSMSMGIGQTAADRNKMLTGTNIFADTGANACAVACHKPSDPVNDTYKYYKDAGVRLRIDAVKEALAEFLDSLRDEGEKSSLTKVSVAVSGDMGVSSSYSLEASIDDAIQAAEGIELEGRPGKGSTELSTNIGTVANEIKTSGNGHTEAKPLTYVILLTDGIENTHPSGPYFMESEFSHPDAFFVDELLKSGLDIDDANDGAYRIQTLNPAVCDPIKDKGATLIVMNVEYGIPEYFARSDGRIQHYTDPEVSGWSSSRRVEALVDLKPHIEDELGKCASHPSLVFSVESEREMERGFKEVLERLHRIRDVRLAR